MVDLPYRNSESAGADGIEFNELDIPTLVDDFRAFVSQDEITLNCNQEELIKEYESLVQQYERIANNEGKELAQKLSGQEKRPEEISLYDEIVERSIDDIEAWRTQNPEVVEKIGRLNNGLNGIFDSIDVPDNEEIEPEIEGKIAGEIINRISALQRVIHKSE